MSRRAKIILAILILFATFVVIWLLAVPFPQPTPPSSVETPPLEDLPATNSRFTIPLMIPLEAVEDALNDAIPTRFQDSRTYRITRRRWLPRIGVRASARITRSGFSVSDSDGRIQLETRASGTVEGHLKALPNPRVQVGLTVSGQAQPRLRSNWHLEPNYTVRVRLRQPRIPEIPIPFGRNIDIADWIEDKVEDEVEDYQEEAQVALTEALSTAAKRAWRSLCQAIPVYSDPNLWLQVEPKSVRTTQLGVDNDNVVLQISVNAQTLVSGNRSDPVCTFPKQLTVADVPRPDIVDLSLPAQANYDDVTSMLAAEVVGTTFGSRWSVQIDSVGLGPHGDALLLTIGARVGVRDDRRRQWRGTLYVSAKPQLHEDAQTITLADLELDVESQNVLVEALGELSEDWLKDAFGERSVVAVEKLLQRVRERVNGSLNRIAAGDVELVARVDSLRLIGVAVGPDHLRVVVSVKGSATATVSPSDGGF